MRELPTGTVTLLFTDIEGSTHLLQQLGERYADLLEECRQLLRTAFHQWNGHEVDTQGDAFFVVFARASDAVAAAVYAQHALASHPWPEDVTVRIGDTQYPIGPSSGVKPDATRSRAAWFRRDALPFGRPGRRPEPAGFSWPFWKDIHSTPQPFWPYYFDALTVNVKYDLTDHVLCYIDSSKTV